MLEPEEGEYRKYIYLLHAPSFTSVPEAKLLLVIDTELYVTPETESPVPAIHTSTMSIVFPEPQT